MRAVGVLCAASVLSVRIVDDDVGARIDRAARVGIGGRRRGERSAAVKRRSASSEARSRETKHGRNGDTNIVNRYLMMSGSRHERSAAIAINRARDAHRCTPARSSAATMRSNSATSGRDRCARDTSCGPRSDRRARIPCRSRRRASLSASRSAFAGSANAPACTNSARGRVTWRRTRPRRSQRGRAPASRGGGGDGAPRGGCERRGGWRRRGG